MADPFLLYAMECEGELDTRQGKINRVIKLLADSGAPNDPEVQMAAFLAANLNPCGLTDQEKYQIESEVSQRL